MRVTIVTSDVLPGGGSTDVSLGGGSEYFDMSVAFSRNTGTITVHARRHGATEFEPITDAVIDLSTRHGFSLLNFPAAELRFIDAGTGECNVTVIQAR